jgi:predicted negative regulator of RcsB-dependent stress response
VFQQLIILIAIVFSTTVLAENKSSGNKDLFFSEGLYYAYQEDYFDAISKIDAELGQYYGLDEPELNSLHFYLNHAEFSIGDFELYYRMHNRAGRAIKSVLEGDVDDKVRNDAAYRLAKIFHQKQQPENALHTIQRIKGDVPDSIKYDLELLKAQIYISNAMFTEAIDLLSSIENVSEAAGYASYNLAIAYIGNNETQKGILQLDKAGQINSSDKAVLAIRDKANLVLGYKLMENKQPERAKKYFERIRLGGPFSNRALLGSGWAAVAAEKYKQAIVPWTMLAKRNVTNQSVQEVLLGLPFAYGKLEFHGKAAVLYGKALEAYSKELEKLDNSIKNIREGKFLEAVVREESRKDKNWLINLRNLPDTPETHYLMQLLASNDFQSSLKNYFDLDDLAKKVASWDGYLDSYTEVIAHRKNYYTPLFPGMQEKFRLLDSRRKLRLAQREKIAERLNKMLISPRPDYLAKVNERLTLNSIYALEKKYAKDKRSNTADIRARINRLKGVIKWNIETEYQERFTEADKNLRLLNKDVDALDKKYRSFVRIRQAATQSFIGYSDQIRQLKNRIRFADEKIQLLLARQGNMLELLSINELQNRRKRIEELHRS